MNNNNDLLVNEICNAIDRNILSVSRTGNIINVEGNTISGKLIYTKTPVREDEYKITAHDGFKWLTTSQAERVYQARVRYMASIEEAAHRVEIDNWKYELRGVGKGE